MSSRIIQRVALAALITLAAGGMCPQRSGAAEENDAQPAGLVARIGAERFAQREPVLCVDLSPDEKTIASAGGKPVRLSAVIWSVEQKTTLVDKKDVRPCSIYLWQRSNGQLLEEFAGHKIGVSDIAFAPDGEQIASCGYDGGVALWTRGAERPAWRGAGTAPRLCVSFSDDGRLIVAGGADGQITAWDRETGRRVWTRPAGFLVMGVAFSAESQRLAAWGRGRSISFQEPPGAPVHQWRYAVWDCGDEKQELVLAESSTVAKFAASISPTAETLVHSTIATLRLRDVRREKSQEFRIRVGPDAVLLSPDGKTAALRHEKTITLRRVEDGATLWRFELPMDVRGLAIPRDGSFLVAGVGRYVICADVTRDATQALTHCLLERLELLAWSPDGVGLITAGETLTQCWRPVRENPAIRDPSSRYAGVRTLWSGGALEGPRTSHLTFSPAGRIVLAARGAAHGDAICLLDSQFRDAQPPLRAPSQRVTTAGLRKDGSQIAVFYGSHALVGLNAGDGDEEFSDSLPESSYDGRLALDGDCLVLRQRERLLLWDVDRRRELDRQPYRHMYQWAVSRDGRYLATYGTRLSDGRRELAVYCLDRRRFVEVMRVTVDAATPTMYSLAFSPDNEVLIGGTFEGAVVFWDVHSGQLVHQQFLTDAKVIAVNWSPNNRLLATADNSGDVLVWDLFTCFAVDRPPTAAERAAAWDALGGGDPAAARHAVWRLAAAGEAALPEARRRLESGLPGDHELDRLVRALDAQDFDSRQHASEEVLALDPSAVDALRKRLARESRPEVAARLRHAVEVLDSNKSRATWTRLLNVVEMIGGETALTLLRRLAETAPSAWQRDASARAVNRLSRIISISNG
jgi:WD40 repeat protein